jgi:hypothetical protein
MWQRRLILTVLVVFVTAGLRAESLWAQTNNLTAAFQTIRTNALWPVSGTTFDAVESTFGPRIKASSGLYDWHRGIDIDAPEGAPVLATLDGTLFDIVTYIDGKVRFTCIDDQPLLNRFDVRIVKKSTNTTVAQHTLDFNERLGFNATTNAALDTPDKTKPYISPISFGPSAASFATDLVIPKTWVGGNSGSKFLTTVTACDIWGLSKTLSW